MLGIFTNDKNFAKSFDNFALLAHWFYRCTYFHKKSLERPPLPRSCPLCPAFGRTISFPEKLSSPRREVDGSDL